MNIGGHIAALRKARGLTQEQLAAQLGVSAPAVSKWETNSSCPDITLLCPLARALGTNVDTLLQFEESLSDQEVAARINEVAEAAIAGDTGAEERLEALLHRPCLYQPGRTAGHAPAHAPDAAAKHHRGRKIPPPAGRPRGGRCAGQTEGQRVTRPSRQFT